MLIKRLIIKGFHDLPIRNTFYQQDDEASEHLAIIYPGVNYTTAYPGLYYPSQVLRSKGADVLHVDHNYTSQEFQSLSDPEQYQWIINDASAAFHNAFTQRTYTQVTLVGKSIGTISLGHLLVNEPSLSKADFIWLTPLLRSQQLRQQISSAPHHGLFVIGTADHHYDPALLDEVAKATGGERLVLENANHSLEIAGNPVESIRMMQRIIERIEQFTSRNSNQ